MLGSVASGYRWAMTRSLLLLLALGGGAAAMAGTAPGDLSACTEDAKPFVVFSVLNYEPTLLERDTLAACLVLEAASEGGEGMRAVMAVIYNRAHGLPELFAPAVLRPRQFSAFNRVTSGKETLARAIGRARQDPCWPDAVALVEQALKEKWRDPTDGATHYTRLDERTPWTRSLLKTVTIGAHSFYR